MLLAGHVVTLSLDGGGLCVMSSVLSLGRQVTLECLAGYTRLGVVV